MMSSSLREALLELHFSNFIPQLDLSFDLPLDSLIIILYLYIRGILFPSSRSYIAPETSSYLLHIVI